jgi:hypothetical protein
MRRWRLLMVAALKAFARRSSPPLPPAAERLNRAATARSQELTQVDTARTRGVDTPVVSKLRRDAKDAALAAFAASKRAGSVTRAIT